MTAEESDYFGQLFGFLKERRLRSTVLGLLLGFSKGDEFRNTLRNSPECIDAILEPISENGLKVLVNVSAEEDLARLVWEAVRDSHLTTDLVFFDSECSLMLLCNLSKIESCKLCLLSEHLKSIAERLPNVYAQHIMTELSTLGNDQVLDYINLESCDDFAFVVLKNLLFDMDNHQRILDSVDFSRFASLAEPSTSLLEFLLLSGTTLRGRQKLRECNVYGTLRQAHLNSTVDECRELIERIVELVVRDEEATVKQ